MWIPTSINTAVMSDGISTVIMWAQNLPLVQIISLPSLVSPTEIRSSVTAMEPRTWFHGTGHFQKAVHSGNTEIR